MIYIDLASEGNVTDLYSHTKLGLVCFIFKAVV